MLLTVNNRLALVHLREAPAAQFLQQGVRSDDSPSLNADCFHSLHTRFTQRVSSNSGDGTSRCLPVLSCISFVVSSSHCTKSAIRRSLVSPSDCVLDDCYLRDERILFETANGDCGVCSVEPRCASFPLSLKCRRCRWSRERLSPATRCQIGPRCRTVHTDLKS